MASFSKRSKERLSTCDIRLQRVMNEVIKYFNFTILCGHRSKEEQMEAFNAKPKRTKVKWPNSKHNSLPSLAVDIAPWPINWEDRERFTFLAGFVLMTGKQLGIELRWGGDWDSDTNLKNNNFDDLPHFELIV